MRRLFLLSLLAFVAIGANAQSAFRCNANNVSVKNGPGSKYRRVLSWGEMPVILSKGDIVYFDGVRRNGYVKISDSSPRQPGWEGGWALAKFFVPMKKKTSLLNIFNFRSVTSTKNKHRLIVFPVLVSK